MFKVTFKFENGSAVEAFAAEGENLLEVARKTNVAIDAPCSGQGMFRKDQVAIDDWSFSKVLECQSIQKEIIRDGFEMLKKDGVLVYSTCTFAKEENEDVINDFINEYEEDAELIMM